MATTISSFSTPPLTSLLQGNGALIIASTAVIAAILIAAYHSLSASEPSYYPGFPLVGKDPSEKTNWQAQQRWFINARDVVLKALKTEKGPFQVISSSGPLIILPPHYFGEIKSDDRMTFKSWLKKDFFTTYPGFQGFIPSVENNVFIDSVRVGLTQVLGQIVSILADETKICMNELFPVKNEWQELHFDEAALRMIARLSSRTFLPEPLCHDEEWLRLAPAYAVDFFLAAYALRSWPPFLRPFVHWFLPETRQLRKDLQLARRLIEPEIKARNKQRREYLKAGKEAPRPIDAIEWLHESSERSGQPCDPVFGQLNYSLGAVHTTTLTFISILYNIVSNPEYIDLLRKEVIDVLREGSGWSKTTMHKLKLMDSFMRESNRLEAASFMTVNRVAEQTVRLSDGTVIPKGAAFIVSNTSRLDPEIYEDPLRFNGHRFYNMRQDPANESKYQFVTTGDEYLPFGHGKHACPGRFFASNEIKVLLCHMLLQYDWKFPEDQGRPETRYIGLDRAVDKTARIMFKARTPEVTLDW